MNIRVLGLAKHKAWMGLGYKEQLDMPWHLDGTKLALEQVDIFESPTLQKLLK